MPGRYCRQDLYAHLYKEMRIFGVRHVMLLASAQGLDDLLMVLSSLSLLLVHSRNGALMPLGLCQEPLQARSTSLWALTTLLDGRATIPTSRITAKDVAKFVFNNICCRFGMPLKIISDRGPGF